jgi:hypothetical protein
LNRYCPYCGTLLPEGASFCGNCGYSVNFVPANDNAEIGETVVLSDLQPEYQPEYQPNYQPEFQPEYQPQYQQDYQPAAPIPDLTPVPSKKKRRWPIVVGSIVAFLVAAAFLWQPIFMRVAPQAYLVLALNRTNADMTKRQEGSPAELMHVAEDCTKKGTIDLNVKYNNLLFSSDVHINADLSLQSDVEKKQWLADFALSSAQMNADLSVFTSNHHISLGTSLFQDGKHYGVTYDSIEDDLRASIFGESLEDEQIDMIVKITDIVQDAINSAGNLDDRFKPYKDLIEKFIKELDADVGRGKVAINGKDKACDTMTFTLDQDDLIDLMEDLMDLLMEEDFIQALGLRDQISDGINEVFEAIEQNCDIEFELTYYFYHAKVAAMGVDIDFELEKMDTPLTAQLLVNYGSNAAKDDIVTEIKIKADGETMKGTIVSSVKKESGNYTETVTLKLGGSAMYGENIEVEFVTKWKKDAEKLEIGFSLEQGENSFEATIPFGLKVKDDGFELSIENVFDVIAAFDQNREEADDVEDGQVCSLVVKFSKKCDISVPEYVNLDKITEDDVTGFMEAMKSLNFTGNAKEDYPDDDFWGNEDWVPYSA